ncbi:Isochorismatase family protein [Kushneria avicenniae]|uniref:Isochorismatase family protein n=1 Tax=Kushneria avicenniae TaxID=402385 RepID=A0A1I1G4X2_9GAMM|nr:isochorismatase family protein [Kushneria avicenniae]SFC06551.1 Isochorismatase family protein [Kushneria avicenniae]
MNNDQADRHTGTAGGPSGPVQTARLDPNQVQILFADLQGNLIDNSRTTPPESISRAAVGLARVADILELPIHHSVAAQAGMDPAVIEPLRPYATADNTYHRVTSGALMDAPTREALSATNRPILVVAGFAAEVVVMQTVLDALAEGYTVFYMVDAIGGLSERSEQAMFRAMEGAGAIPSSVASFAARLAPDFDRAPGTGILEVILSL